MAPPPSPPPPLAIPVNASFAVALSPASALSAALRERVRGVASRLQQHHGRLRHASDRVHADVGVSADLSFPPALNASEEALMASTLATALAIRPGGCERASGGVRVLVCGGHTTVRPHGRGGVGLGRHQRRRHVHGCRGERGAGRRVRRAAGRVACSACRGDGRARGVPAQGSVSLTLASLPPGSVQLPAPPSGRMALLSPPPPAPPPPPLAYLVTDARALNAQTTAAWCARHARTRTTGVRSCASAPPLCCHDYAAASALAGSRCTDNNCV
jgi:hypothetical protein